MQRSFQTLFHIDEMRWTINNQDVHVLKKIFITFFKVQIYYSETVNLLDRYIFLLYKEGTMVLLRV